MTPRSTSHKNQISEVLWDGAYGLSSLSEKTWMSNLILLWIWNYLKDNNYVVLVYRIRLSGRLGSSNLEISGDRSADKSSLQDQDEQQIVSS